MILWGGCEYQMKDLDFSLHWSHWNGKVFEEDLLPRPYRLHKACVSSPFRYIMWLKALIYFDSMQFPHLTTLSTFEIQMTFTKTQFQFQTIHTFFPIDKEALTMTLLGQLHILSLNWSILWGAVETCRGEPLMGPENFLILSHFPHCLFFAGSSIFDDLS